MAHDEALAADIRALLVRCDPAQTDGVSTEADLARWVDVGVAYARSLPAK